MDLPEDKKKLSGDLKNLGALLKAMPPEFKGALHLVIGSAASSCEADLLVHNGFIISAALKEPSTKRAVYGESAFQEINGRIRSSAGTLSAYALTDNEFHLIVNANEGALLENVREVGIAFADARQAKAENKPDAGVDDLQTQWSNLLGAWKKIEEKEKPYMEMLAQEELKAESEEEAANQIILADEMLARSRKAEAERESEPAQQTIKNEKPPEQRSTTREDSFGESMKFDESGEQDPPEGNSLEGLDEKPEDRLLDEMILRDEAGEDEKKKNACAVESISSRQENAAASSTDYYAPKSFGEQATDLPGKERVNLRDEIREERKRLAVPEKQAVKSEEGLEDAITEDILKEIEERFVKAPDEPIEAVEDVEFQPEPQAEETDDEEEKEEEEKPRPPEDEEAVRDNKILADQIRQELREHIKRMRASVQESEAPKKPPEPKPLQITVPALTPPVVQKKPLDVPPEKMVLEAHKDRPPQPLFERIPVGAERKGVPALRPERIVEAVKKETLIKMPPVEPPKQKDMAPEIDAPAEEDIKEEAPVPEEVTVAPEETPQEVPLQLASSDKPEEWMDKASAEIQKLKKSVDVTWGWDKTKKRFVGKEKLPQKPQAGIVSTPAEVKTENIPQPLAAPQASVQPAKPSAAPIGSAAAEQKPPITPPQHGAESKPIKPQVIESAQEQLSRDTPLIPLLKKKMGFLDKLKFAASKEAILVIQTIDGKKTLEDISKETALKVDALKPIIEKLMDEGYVSIKK